jgi:ABC-type transporter MlaC component
MLMTRFAAARIAALCLSLTWPTSLRAEIQQEVAASYIRALFDTSLQPGEAAADICPDVAKFGRFAAGRAWHGLTDSERNRFSKDFCSLAIDAVTRLRSAFPGLRLELEVVSPGPQGMAIVVSRVVRPARKPWPVKWVVATDGDHLRLADLRILDISLGIFLRSLTALQEPVDTGHPGSAARILGPWRQALDRAFPPVANAP